MTNLDVTTGTSPDCDFLTALPISDGTVTIRTMSIADAEAYATGTDDALVKRFAHLPLENYTSEIVSSMIEGAIAEGLRDGTLAVLTIADSNSDAFLGSLVFFDITHDDAEVGYWVTPEHRGRRISSRALTLARDISRALGLKRLRARTVMDNPASTKVLLDAATAIRLDEFRPVRHAGLGQCACDVGARRTRDQHRKTRDTVERHELVQRQSLVT